MIRKMSNLMYTKMNSAVTVDYIINANSDAVLNLKFYNYLKAIREAFRILQN